MNNILQGDLPVIRFFNPKWLGWLIALAAHRLPTYHFLGEYSCSFTFL